MRLLFLAVSLSTLAPLMAQDAADEIGIAGLSPESRLLAADRVHPLLFRVNLALNSTSRGEVRAVLSDQDGAERLAGGEPCATVRRELRPGTVSCLVLLAAGPPDTRRSVRFALMSGDRRLAVSPDPVEFTFFSGEVNLTLEMPETLIDRQRVAGYAAPFRATIAYKAPATPAEVVLQVARASGDRLDWLDPIQPTTPPAQPNGTLQFVLPADYRTLARTMRFRAAYRLPSGAWFEGNFQDKPVYWIDGSLQRTEARPDQPFRAVATMERAESSSPRQWFCAFRYVAAGVPNVRYRAAQDLTALDQRFTEMRCDLEPQSKLESLRVFVLSVPPGFDGSQCNDPGACPEAPSRGFDIPVAQALDLGAARTGSVSGAGATLSKATGGTAATTTVRGGTGNLNSPLPGSFSKSLSAASLPVTADLPSFIGINRVWNFDPVVPESSGFQAELTLAYLESDLPDDPGFDESKLTVVSYDSSTGALRAWPTTLDRANRLATARISGIAGRYTLGVYGPFQRRFWNFAALPSFDGLQTALTFVNAGLAPANLSTRVFSADGRPLNDRPAPTDLAAGRQWTGLVTGIAPQASSQRSWAQAASEVSQVLTLAWIAGRTGAAALPAPPLYAYSQLLPEIEWKPGLAARIDVANPTAFESSVTVDLYDAQGMLTGSRSLDLPAKAGNPLEAATLFAGKAPESFSGYAVVRGSQETAAAQVVTSAAAISALPGRALPAAGPATRFYAPHVLAGDPGSRLTLVNTGSGMARVVARLVRDDGAFVAAPVILAVEPGRQLQRTVGSIFAIAETERIAAALVLESDTSSIGATLTHLDSNGGLGTRASMALETQPDRSAMLPQFVNAGGYSTWIAVQNTTATAATAQVRVMAPDGSRAGTGTLRIPSGGRASAGLSQLVPQAEGMATGYIVVEADQPVAATGWIASSLNPVAAVLPAQQVYTPPAPPTTAAPSLALSVSSLDFGSISPGQSADREVALRNTGTATLQVSALEIASPFRVVQPLAPFTVAAGLSASLTVRFVPSATGAWNGTLTIASNDPRNPRATVSLTGSGAGSQGTGTSLRITPTALEFGTVEAGTTRDLLVNVSNPADAPMRIDSASSSNGAFSVASPTLPATIAAGTSVVVTVRFSPAVAGAHSATITLVAGTGALTIAATGNSTGVSAGGRIGVTPANLDFGNVQAGNTRDQTFSISNTAQGPLQVTSITSTNALFTLVSPAVPFTVSPGVLATVTVRFSPAAAGEQRGTLRVVSSGGTAEVPMAGGGTPLVVTTIFSDTFDREGTTPCTLGPADNALGGSQIVYYHPLYRYPIAERIVAIGAEIQRGALGNPNFDYGGVQFSGSEDACNGGAASAFRQDFTLKVDITLPPGPDPEQVTQAGPFFRTRMHEMGASLAGEHSAGFWLQLHSNGQVTLKRLATNEVFASTPKPASFNGRVRHTLEMTVQGSTLHATLDGVLLRFDRGSTVTLPVETLNQGGAGIAFGAEQFRGQVAGQTVDNLVVTTPRPLTGTP